ncbi:potassium transporter Trk [Tyzzerella sp. An114]|uniref:potassium channel family protein n=1 Tax=Tyzzerella sp. An114 TaxID=1965545 RepID=UPI000B432ACD|nr:TrkA family potassium uptake protein [Tyzzerella sp. An114]OUQ59962.1 potassium transporter Trk [Tyzzerella sp. An114]HIT73141.1 TrkA family potassium uptake protein [Candidatus Fimicola cottocaccae]
MKLNNQFIVLGLGRFGMSVAKTLSDKGFDVLAVDNNAEVVQNALEFVTHAVKADMTDEIALKSLGIGNFDVAIIAIGSKLEASVMATLIAKEAGVKYIVAKAQDERSKKVLQKIGADRVIFPEREMGVRVANSLLYGNFFEFMELSDEFGIAEIPPNKDWIGKTIAGCEVRAKYGLNIVAIKHGGKVEVTPSATYVFEEEDIVIVLGENSIIQDFMEKKSIR